MKNQKLYAGSSRRAFVGGGAAMALAHLSGCAHDAEQTREHPDTPALLPPRELPWPLRDVNSAETSLTYDDDGRMRLNIEHEVLRGVTPKMLVWWFNNIEGTMELNGKQVPRYHVWHPIDHIDFWVTKRSPSGKVVPGTEFHIVEAFGGNLDHLVNNVSVIEKLDETGFIHGPQMFGSKFAHMAYTFHATEAGTLYKNFMVIGPQTPLLKQAVNLARPWLFTEEKGRAWLKHNVEEVGLLEHFLPRLFHEHQR